MSFRLPLGGRSANRDRRLFNEDELVWGVPRRAGYDERDDPKAHAGQTQHAFEAGNDERAICGFEPPKRAGGPTQKPRPQLAVPTARLNPRCPKCVRLIAIPEAEPEVVAQEAAPAAVAAGPNGTELPPPAPPEIVAASEVADARELFASEATAAPDAQTAEPEYASQLISETQAAAESDTGADPDTVAAPPPSAEPQEPAEPDFAAARNAVAEPRMFVEPPLEPLPGESVAEMTVGPDEPIATLEESEAPAAASAPPDGRHSAEPPIVAPPAPWGSVQHPSILRRPPVPPPPAPPPVQTTLPMTPSPNEAPARTESWEGTAKFVVGQVSTVVHPPEKPGLGVVASVVAGPSGTRVASVTMNADGTALISLSDPARAPVTVAWFVVPVVDQ